MFYSLRGTLVYTGDSSLAVECGGVAYQCRTTLSALQQIGRLGSEVTIFTYLSVRNESLELFGFLDQQELDCFKMLIGVTGVGPKVALAILSSITPARFALCVAAGDYKPITAAPGVGKKLAERITLELRDKVGAAEFSSSQTAAVTQTARSAGNVAEAISALVVLGYSQTDATVAVSEIPEDTPVEEIIKLGLKKLARRR